VDFLWALTLFFLNIMTCSSPMCSRKKKNSIPCLPRSEMDVPQTELCALFQDVYFDDESAEMVISSLCLGDDQDR
jgi:hypothetical protein